MNSTDLIELLEDIGEPVKLVVLDREGKFREVSHVSVEWNDKGERILLLS